MFDRIKLFFRGAGLVFKHGDLIGNVISAWHRYPGLEQSEPLRNWLRPLLRDSQALALLTKTQIDDLVVFAALRVIDNDRAWNVVHAMALLAQEGSVFKDGVLIPEATAYQSNMVELADVAQEVLPGSPILLHAVIGLLLLILKRKIQ